MSIFKKIKPIDLFITCTFAIFSIICIYVYASRDLYPMDFDGNRIICGYVLNGINPLKHINETPLIDYLGVVPYGYGNLPYGLLLGNLFYFGFFNYTQALLLYKISSVIFIVITLVLAKRYFVKHNYGNRIYYYFVLFTLLSINILGSYRIGNIGHIICMLILIMIFFADENVIISGIALSLAMIKPQVAFPFVITLLFMKRIKVVMLAAAIDVFASIICAMLVKESVISMFLDFFSAQVGLGTTSYGVLTMFFPKNYYEALFPSMICGMIILITSHIFTKEIKNTLCIFAFPTLVANIWSYSWNSDYYILILPAIVFSYLYFRNDSKSRINIFIKTFLLTNVYFLLFIWAARRLFRGYDFLPPFLGGLYQDKGYIERIVFSNTITYFMIVFCILISIFVFRYYHKKEII